MKKGFWLFFGMVALLLVSAGCASSRVAMDYGTSYNLAKFNQTLNPEAVKNLEPVAGFDGEAARAALEKYRTGFEKPTPPPVYMFNVGVAAR